MKKFNKIAVIMPCHNKSLMTRMCIESIFNQIGYQQLTVAVCDNNSQDDTWNMLNELQASYGAISLRITRNCDPNNFGPARGNNLCLAMVKEADLVCRVDNDTIFPRLFWTRFIEHAERRMQEHSNIGVFCARPLEQDNFGTEDGTPNTPQIDDAPLGRWYYQQMRRDLQLKLTENTFFNTEEVHTILNSIYLQGHTLTNCPPTMDGYHEWIYHKFKDKYDLYPGGFTPALYAWTRETVDSCPWHDEITFTHSDLEDNNFMYCLARMGWTTCTFHDLFFHHWGSLTREYTGRHRLKDGKTMNDLFHALWEKFNEQPGFFNQYIMISRENGKAWTQDPNPKVPDDSLLKEKTHGADINDYKADIRTPRT